MDVRRGVTETARPHQAEALNAAVDRASVFAFALVDGRIRRKQWCPIERCYRMARAEEATPIALSPQRT